MNSIGRTSSVRRAWVTTGAWSTWLVLAAGCNDTSTAATGDASSSGSSGPVDEFPGSSDSDGADSSSGGESVLQFCDGAFAVRYDPAANGIHAFPDDLWTEDADTPTGISLISPFDRLDSEDPAAGFPSVFSRLPSLDGFGTTAPVFVRVTGAIDPASLPAPGDEADPVGSALLLVDIDADPVEFVAFDWRVVEETGLDEGTTLLLYPLRPLRPGHRHGVVMTRGVTDTDGDCFAPSPAMRELLEVASDDPALERLLDRHTALLTVLRDSGTIVDADELSAAVVYTTATTIRQSTTIAKAIANSLPAPVVLEECFTSGAAYPFRTCNGSLNLVDFTDDDGIITGTEPQSTYVLPYAAYLPREGTGPFPTVIFGHALTGDRTSAWIPAMRLAEAGFAVIAIDSPKHGEHPDHAVTNTTFDLLGLGNDPNDPFDPFDARDNFRQAAFDKLQLVRRLVAGLDVTGDDVPDFDATRLQYHGDSLGAVMGSQFLAYSDDMLAATLVVGGANLTNIVIEASEFKPLVGIVTQSFSDDERDRLLAITQTAIDGGDPLAFAPYVFSDRLNDFDALRPHVLLQMALDDTVVPNSSTAYLVRALGVPILGEAVVPMRAVDVVAGLPQRANVDGMTGGLVQYALMDGPAGISVPATHRGLQGDENAVIQQQAFQISVEDPRGPEIIDPFAR